MRIAMRRTCVCDSLPGINVSGRASQVDHQSDCRLYLPPYTSKEELQVEAKWVVAGENLWRWLLIHKITGLLHWKIYRKPMSWPPIVGVSLQIFLWTIFGIRTKRYLFLNSWEWLANWLIVVDNGNGQHNYCYGTKLVGCSNSFLRSTWGLGDAVL